MNQVQGKYSLFITCQLMQAPGEMSERFQIPSRPQVVQAVSELARLLWAESLGCRRGIVTELPQLACLEGNVQ